MGERSESKPYVPARRQKNHLFIGATDSGHWAATFYPLLGSCLRRKVNPREYLHWLLIKLPTVSAANTGHSSPAVYAENVIPVGCISFR